MTLPPERIGDRGQRWVLRIRDYPNEKGGWQNCLYSDTLEGAVRAQRSFLKHPLIEETQVVFRFAIGDEVWWHVPTVMASCRTWAPDITKPTKIIAVNEGNWIGIAHPQQVRVAPSYCPYGDEFGGSWFLPIGFTDHNALRRAIEAA